MKVVLGMSANQFPIPGEGDITFQNTRTHARCRNVGFTGMFGKLQGRATMADGEIRFLDSVGIAGLQALFERTAVPCTNQPGRPGSPIWPLYTSEAAGQPPR